MKYYNEHTGEVGSKPLSVILGGRRVTDANRLDDGDLVAAGWRVITSDTPKPSKEYYEDVQNRTVTILPDGCVNIERVWLVSDRIAQLAAEHSGAVQTLVNALAQFGLCLPIESADAIAAMFARLENAPELGRWAMLAQTMYGSLSAVMSDHDIFLISEVL